MVVHPVSHGVSRVPRYSGSQLTQITCRIRGSHPLWPAFPCRSPKLLCRCAGPQPQRINPLVWPLPISLATTFGISVDVSSSSYLDVSVQTVPRVHLFYSMHATEVLLQWVSPFGNLRINGYLLLPEAYRSLSRPSSAPDAKTLSARCALADASHTRAEYRCTLRI